MKKISLLFLTVLFIFSFSIDLKADCFDDDLNEWATKISPKFVENDSEYFFAYFLTIDPYRDDVIIKVTDKDGESAFGKKYEAMNLYGVGCYTNIEAETYRIDVYGGENSKCKNELLRTFTYTVEQYNDMVKTEECENHPEHELCQAFTNKTQNMTREDFSKEIVAYEKNMNKSKYSLSKVFDLIREYGVYILFPFFIITLIYIIKIQKFKKKESNG